MRTSRAIWAIAFLAVLGVPMARAASPLDEESAGLDALDASDFDQAIAHFSAALASGALSADDQQQALAGRGRAYLKRGQISAAIADLDRARRMRPDDLVAQNDLALALAAALPVAAVPGAPKAHVSLTRAIGKTILGDEAANLAASGASDEGLIGGQ